VARGRQQEEAGIDFEKTILSINSFIFGWVLMMRAIK
jgi:hypothetical protein